jgi:hypothetical protein
MTNQRIRSTFIALLSASVLLVALGCGEEETPGPVDPVAPVDVIDEKPSTESTASIRGLLVDEGTKQTLRDTRVKLVDSKGEVRETSTTRAGVFEFENLAAGEKVTVVVELDGYEKHESVVTPIAGEATTTITVNLVPIIKEDALPPGDGLRVGTKAPNFNLVDGNGKRHSLADYAGKQRVLLLFDRGAW